MIEFGREIVSDFAESYSLEWLETNGIGGYALGTISGAHSRRYHGLLVAATKPPLGRQVLLSKLEDTLLIGDRRYDLSSNLYPGAIHPEGHKFIKKFRLEPFPVWTYQVAGIELEKRIFMVYGENSTVVAWKVTVSKPSEPVSIEVKPLLAFRDHHHLVTDHAGNWAYEASDRLVSLNPRDGSSRLFISHNGGPPEYTGHWYRGLEYAIERERGFDFHEDLYQPFSLRFDLAEDALLIVSTEEPDVVDAGQLEESEKDRRDALLRASAFKDDVTAQLVLAADQFVVARGEGHTVIAGYPWFSDWGRDTMIALPGLTLATGRHEIAKSILLEFSKYISDGMIPNRFPDEGETADYNTVDATLWYFEAIRAYISATGDNDIVRDGLYEGLVEMIDWHVRGTRYGIHVDTDGLLYAGDAGTQLTWMDAKIGDLVITPRNGKPVEIQALWYNALCIMSELAELTGDDSGAETYRHMATAAKTSFNGQFWNEAERCLYDVVNGNEKDPSIRPNQIFAVSLAHPIVEGSRARDVVTSVRSHLLTQFGLRTLAPGDKRYAPIYKGTPLERDSSYHQGTVWAWLIGPFIDAYRRVNMDGSETEGSIRQMIDGFRPHLEQAVVGQISEIFDAEEPHSARGCGAQAWSVAELLRISSAPK